MITGTHHTKVAKEMIKKGNLGKKYSIKTKKKISEARKKTNGMTGKKGLLSGLC
jgi:hypothetical protein